MDPKAKRTGRRKIKDQSLTSTSVTKKCILGLGEFITPPRHLLQISFHHPNIPLSPRLHKNTSNKIKIDARHL